MLDKIKHIYVINLTESSDRKKYMIELFKKNNITNYSFFNAVSYKSNRIQNLMKTNFVKKFPPCFRCHKLHCDCSNNFLLDKQVANFSSFIDLMKIIENKPNHQIFMICEDDICFTKLGIHNINFIFKTKKFNLNQPFLLRLSKGFSNLHNLKITPKLNQKITMSNPCFVINSLYAKSFLNHLKHIYTTSDLYIHRDLVKKDKSIQHFTLFPIPIYELSTNKFKQFKSTIIPKAGDLPIIKKKIFKKFLILASPRSGTNSSADFLQQLSYKVGHENMQNDGISSWMCAVNSNDYPFQKPINLQQFHFENIIHIVRNPFNIIPSLILENKYSPNNKSYLFRRHFIQKEFNINLPENTLNHNLTQDIETAILTYIFWNKIIDKNKPTLTIKLENLNSFNRFSKNNKKIEKLVKKNQNKLYEGKHYDKPNIKIEDYKKIKVSILNLLKQFCLKYNYEYIIN